MLESGSFNHQILAGETVLGSGRPQYFISVFFQHNFFFFIIHLLFYAADRTCHGQNNLLQ